MQRILKIGTNRNKPRIWIEGQALAAQGWTKGDTFDCHFLNGSIEYVRDPKGLRKVAGTSKRPIIDTNTGKIREYLGPASHVLVKIEADRITMTPTDKPKGKLAGAVAAIAIAAATLAAPYISQFAPGAQRVLVACEESATVRNAFAKLGHDAVSCDLLDTRDPTGWHIRGDVTPYLRHEWDLLLAFPPCTYLTNSAAWAFKDPDFDRYPGIGYHQKLKPGTLTGEARRKARDEAVAFVKVLYSSCERVAIENPTGALSKRFRRPDQIINPHDFGDPESKATCLWIKGLTPLIPTHDLDIEEHGWLITSGPHKGKWRWQNQTAGGQNKLPPSEWRDRIRSKTYPGIAAAMALQWGGSTARSTPRRTPRIPIHFI
jgi:hypothetical protein